MVAGLGNSLRRFADRCSVSATARILVASDAVSDAALVRKLLGNEFEDIAISTNAELVLRDFEKCRPDVLVLAFDALENAQDYYLGLYRQSTLIHALPHRTIVLCGKNELQRTYELCRSEEFDDYVLFWPMVHDAPRLCMAIHNALRQLAADRSPRASEFAAQTRRIAELETLLDQSLKRGLGHIATASDSLAQTQQESTSAQQQFLNRLTDGLHPDWFEVKDRDAFLRDVERFQAEQAKLHAHALAAVRPVREWAAGIQDALAPQLASVRALQALADLLRPQVLAVDDDEFQLQLLRRMFADAEFGLTCVGSGAEALASLRKHRPDLVLMDFHLPGMDGVEVTRRLKAAEQFRDIPVVMITGNSGKEVVVKSLQAGAIDFLVKPFNRDTLLAKIHSLLALAPL